VACEKNGKSCARASAKTGIPSLTALTTSVIGSTAMAAISAYAPSTAHFQRRKETYERELPLIREVSTKVAAALDAFAVSALAIGPTEGLTEGYIKGLAEYTAEKYFEAHDTLDELDGALSKGSIARMKRYLSLVPILIRVSRANNILNKTHTSLTARSIHELAKNPGSIEPPSPENHSIRTAIGTGSSMVMLSSAIAAAYLRYKKQAYQSRSLEHKKAKKFWADVMGRVSGQSANDYKRVALGRLTAFYNRQEFNLEAAQSLTDKFSGTQLSEKTLKGTLISLNQPSHIIRMDDNGTFLLNSPIGHIYYARLDDRVAQIKFVVPRQGCDAALTRILANISPKSSSNWLSPSKERLAHGVR
jgi:hypothetical protein